MRDTRKRPSQVDKKKGQKAPPTPSSSSVMFSRIILLIMFIFVSYIAYPTMIFLFFAMLPTLVSFLVERDKHQYKWLCVGFFNLSGSFWYLLGLWFGSHSIGNTISILTDVSALVVIYFSACLGLFIHTMFPRFITTFLHVSAYRRVAYLQNLQQQLVEKWGEEVKTSKVEVQEDEENDKQQDQQ